MNPLITRLDTWLQQYRPNYYARLAPGASEAELADLERLIGHALPEEFRDLYRWRNGQAANSYEAFCDNRMFMSLETIATNWTMMKEMLEEGEFELPNWWRTNWVAFLENGGGDSLCLDMEGTFTGQPGQLLEFWHDWENRQVVWPNTASFLATLVASFEGGTWSDSEDCWETNESLFPAGYPQRFDA